MSPMGTATTDGHSDRESPDLFLARLEEWVEAEGGRRVEIHVRQRDRYTVYLEVDRRDGAGSFNRAVAEGRTLGEAADRALARATDALFHGPLTICTTCGGSGQVDWMGTATQCRCCVGLGDHVRGMPTCLEAGA